MRPQKLTFSHKQDQIALVLNHMKLEYRYYITRNVCRDIPAKEMEIAERRNSYPAIDSPRPSSFPFGSAGLQNGRL